MKFKDNNIVIDITVISYTPAQEACSDCAPVPEEFELTGVILDDNGNELCPCPDKYIEYRKQEIIETLKEELYNVY